MKILEMQKWIKENPEEAARKGWSSRAACALDDVINNKSLRNDGRVGALGKFYTLGRHFEMSVATAAQRTAGVHPNMRDNVDYVAVFRITNEKEKEHVWQEYMGRLNRKTAFELMELYTRVDYPDSDQEQRYCLIIALDPKLSYNERFFVAAPVKPPDFMMGNLTHQKEFCSAEQCAKWGIQR
jgi:hypothetical protein